MSIGYTQSENATAKQTMSKGISLYSNNSSTNLLECRECGQIATDEPASESIFICCQCDRQNYKTPIANLGVKNLALPIRSNHNEK